MGRAMIIICAGVLVSLGIVGISTSNKGKMLAQGTTTYANEIAAKNAAHTAIQIAMQEINKDSTWAENHGPNTPWEPNEPIDGAVISLYAEYLNSDYNTNNYWEVDSLRLVSQATYYDDYDADVISVYLKAPFSSLVPDFEGALTLATNQIFPFTTDGSASINGNAPPGSGCSENKPGVTIKDPTSTSMDSSAYMAELNDLKDFEGSQKLKVKKDLSYQPTDKLIERLSNTDDVQYLSGSYKGDMGTASDPGVFFVEEPTKLTGGISEGYGILVVRSSGEMSYEEDGSELSLAGNFTFNGLVIFENAYNFDGKGTPTINGSVLIGNTEDYTGDIDVDLNGNIHLQYDCRGENYAKKAAALAVKQNKYTRIVTYE